MNAIFTVVVLLSTAAMLIINPQEFIGAALDGGEGAVKCALTLFCIYTLWMGLSAVAEESGITNGVARALSPIIKRLFKTGDNRAVRYLSMNVSCNLLGIGGAATPYAVKAIGALEKEGNRYAQDLLFIINATSIQLVPTTVIALRASLSSAAPHDVALPSIIATAISTLTAVGLYVISCKIRLKRRAKRTRCNT